MMIHQSGSMTPPFCVVSLPATLACRDRPGHPCGPPDHHGGGTDPPRKDPRAVSAHPAPPRPCQRPHAEHHVKNRRLPIWVRCCTHSAPLGPARPALVSCCPASPRRSSAGSPWHWHPTQHSDRRRVLYPPTRAPGRGVPLEPGLRELRQGRPVRRRSALLAPQARAATPDRRTSARRASSPRRALLRGTSTQYGSRAQAPPLRDRLAPHRPRQDP